MIADCAVRVRGGVGFLRLLVWWLYHGWDQILLAFAYHLLSGSLEKYTNSRFVPINCCLAKALGS